MPRTPLPAGTIIDYLGTRAVVVEDTGGNDLKVTVDGIDTRWSWVLDGETCTIPENAKALKETLMTERQIAYLLRLAHAERDFDEESRHIPECDSGERDNVIALLEAAKA